MEITAILGIGLGRFRHGEECRQLASETRFGGERPRTEVTSWIWHQPEEGQENGYI